MHLKLLFVGINYRYINPTVSLIPPALGRECSLYFYGPGFSDPDTLERGLDRYLESIRGVDAIFATKDFCGDFEAVRLARFVDKYVVMLNDGRVSDRVMKDISRVLQQNRSRVIVPLIDVDPHAVQQVTLDAFSRHGEFFLCWGQGFVNTLGDREAAAREGHLRKKEQKWSYKLGLFDEFVKANYSQIINVGHFVADQEFYWGDLENRKYEVVVPGTQYARRDDTKRALRRSKNVSLSNPRYRLGYQIAERLSLKPLTHFYLSHLFNLGFQRSLSQAKVCVTDGGMNNFPVRKFFEIPAAGAVMVCWPPEGSKLLGFKDRVNCIEVGNESEVIAVAEEIAANPKDFQNIASAGRELVRQQHSVGARTAQINTALRRILAGTFRGSSWSDGQFVCDE